MPCGLLLTLTRPSFIYCATTKIISRCCLKQILEERSEHGLSNNKFATLLTLIATMSRNQIRTKTRSVASFRSVLSAFRLNRKPVLSEVEVSLIANRQSQILFRALPNPPEAERVGLSAISFFSRGGGHPECSDEIGMYRRTIEVRVNEKRMPLQSLTRLIPQPVAVSPRNEGSKMLSRETLPSSAKQTSTAIRQFPLLKEVTRNEAGDSLITSSLHHLIA